MFYNPSKLYNYLMSLLRNEDDERNDFIPHFFLYFHLVKSFFIKVFL